MEKQAGVPLAQILAAIAGYSLMASDRAHVQNLRTQTSETDQAARAQEAARMEQMIGNLSNDKLSAVAQGIGSDLAKLSAAADLEMDKEAIGALVGAIGRGAGALLRGGGKALGSAGRMGGTHRFQQAARRMGVDAGKPAGAGGALRRAGVGMQQAGKRLGSGASTFQRQAVLGKPGKPLIGTGTKLKLLGGAGVLGAGYAGMKGMQTARDYMMVPSGQGGYGRHGAPLMHNVGQYGYPTY